MLNFKSCGECINETLFSDVISGISLLSNLILYDVHSALCQATSFTNHNFMTHSHVLNAFNILNQNLFFLQSMNWKRNGKRNTQWKSFWDSNNENNDRNNSNLGTFEKNCKTKESLVDARDIDDQEDKMCEDTECHNKKSKLFNLFSCNSKLWLQMSLSLRNNKILTFSKSRKQSVITNSTYNSFTLTWHYLGISK